jgi:hypothetical protein
MSGTAGLMALDRRCIAPALAPASGPAPAPNVRVGVIGHPVAKTAVVAKAVSPGPSPVAKTAVAAAAVTPGRGVRRRL